MTMSSERLSLDYNQLLQDPASTSIQLAQVRADLAVNQDLMLLYWQIGQEILFRRGLEVWGSKMILERDRALPLSWMPNFICSSIAVAWLLVVGLSDNRAMALPPPEDVPEEVLREEVILQGRSPIDGSALSTVEYAELEAELADFPEDSVAVNPEVQSLVFQLKLLRLLKDVVPFW